MKLFDWKKMSQIDWVLFIIVPGVAIIMVAFLLTIKIASELHLDNYPLFMLILLIIIIALGGLSYFFIQFALVYIIPPMFKRIMKICDNVCLKMFGVKYRRLKNHITSRYMNKSNEPSTIKEEQIKEETNPVVTEEIRGEGDNQDNTLNEFEKCCLYPDKANKIERIIREFIEVEENKTSSLALIITCAIQKGLIKEKLNKRNIIRYFQVDKSTFYEYWSRYANIKPDEEWSPYISSGEKQAAERYMKRFEDLKKSIEDVL